MIRNIEIARVSGGASGLNARDTQSGAAGSVLIATTNFRLKPNKIASSRPAALRSGIYPGESRGEVGQKVSDVHWRSADLAHIPASAGAIPTTRSVRASGSVSGSHHSVRTDGRSAIRDATPIIQVPSASFPSNGSPPTRWLQTPSSEVSAGNHSASADRTEGAISCARSTAGAPPLFACSPRGGDLDQLRCDALRRSVEIAFITPTAEPPKPGQLASVCKSGATGAVLMPIEAASLPTIRSSAGRAGSTIEREQPSGPPSIPQPFTAEAYPQPEVPTP